MTVVVRERGAVSLSKDEWRAISSDPSFRDLVSRSILGARPGRYGEWELTAYGFVGQTRLGGLDIVVEEKVAGGFRSLLEITSPRSYKVARAPSRAALGRPPQDILAEMHIAAVRSYLSGYALSEYREERATGSYVLGRLDVPRTSALHARGLRHRVAFRRDRLTDDVALNRVIWRALGELAGATGALGVAADLASSARALRVAFADSADAARLMTRREVIVEALAEAGAGARPTAVAEAAELSLAVLQGASATFDEPAEGQIPRSWFVNLENLFERALRRCVADAMTGEAEVSGPDRGASLFIGPPSRYPANPDVVVRCDGRVAILDAKYKDRTDAPSADEVYQLVAHAAASGADRAALLYPSDGLAAWIPLGPSVTGCMVWAFGVDLRRPRQSIKEALEIMGFSALSHRLTT